MPWMDGIAEVLADALKVHGATVERDVVLEGRSGEVYTVPLLLDLEGRAVLVWPDLERTRTVAQTEALRQDLGADGAVLIGHETPAGATVGWDRATLSRLLGDALLAECGLPSAPVPWPTMGMRRAAPAPEAPAPPASPFQAPSMPAPEETAAPAPQTEPLLEMDPLLAAMGPTGAPGASDALGAPGAPDTPGPPDALDVPDVPEAPDAPDPRMPEELDDLLPDAFHEPGIGAWDLDAPEPEPEIRRLPVRVTPRDAQRTVHDRLGTVDDYALVLDPVHIFDAEVETFRRGSLDATMERVRLQVHATERRVEVVDPAQVDPNARDLLPEDHAVPTTERALRIPLERAQEHALEWLRAEYTRVVEVPSSEGDLYAYTERRRVAPRDDQLRLTLRGTFHRPVWRLRGPSGTVDVDALTGAAVDSQLTSYPDAVLLD